VLPQFFQSGSGSWNPPYALTIVLTLLWLALLADGWHRWANRAFGSNHEASRKRSTSIWPLRPSNLLMLFAAGFNIYEGLQDPPIGSRSSIGFTAMIFWLAFVIRHWENEALRK